MSLRRLLLGRRLANREQAGRRIGAFEAVPAMGLDGLGSAAYGPEAALAILLPLGAAGLAVFGPIIAAIVVLLLILFASYWQTIKAYPSNGGAYIVSKANLGTGASLIAAAAALMVDYVLNVAVAISAGVGALVSAVPALHRYTLALCLAILVVVALANLRGALDAGRLFALPTYVFVASFLLVLAIGTYEALASGGAPHAIVPPPPPPAGTGPVTLWLVLRAFASGCTAMTGVEAVSNGMTAFKQPVTKYGHRTLAIIDGRPLCFDDIEPPVVLVATRRWNKLTDKALGFALRLSPEVSAVHLTRLDSPDDDDAAAIRAQWARDVEAPARAAGLKPPRLLLLRADYRLLDEPLLKLLQQLQEEFPRRTIAVLLPELVKTSWWQFLLHTHRARRLRARLLRFGGSRLAIINIPWYLKEPRIEQGLAEAAGGDR